MRDRSQLSMIAAIARLREAQIEAARSALLAANERVRQQEENEDQHRHARDESLGEWLARLAGSTFDPMHARLRGTWLLEQERQLGTSHLDTAIVRERQSLASETLAIARSRSEVSRDIHRRLEKALAKDREERQSAEMADNFLHRRRR